MAAFRHQAATAVRVDPEWGGFRSRDIARVNGPELAGFVATNTMLPKITFADNTLDDLHAQLKSAEESFRRSKQFGGMAIHSYESFQKLSNIQRVASQP